MRLVLGFFLSQLCLGVEVLADPLYDNVNTTHTHEYV